MLSKKNMKKQSNVSMNWTFNREKGEIGGGVSRKKIKKIEKMCFSWYNLTIHLGKRKLQIGKCFVSTC